MHISIMYNILRIHYQNFRKKFKELTILQQKIYLFLFSKFFKKEIRKINDFKTKILFCSQMFEEVQSLLYEPGITD